MYAQCTRSRGDGGRHDLDDSGRTHAGWRCKKRPHVIPLSPQAADNSRAARALARLLESSIRRSVPSRGKSGQPDAPVSTTWLSRALPTIHLAALR